MTSIITGDIINSRNISSEKWLDVVKSVFTQYGETPKSWEIFRGDSFQLETKASEALKACLLIKSNIKCITDIDVRLAIGLGNKSYHSDKITEANGEAFINSGFAFDNLLKKQNLAIKSPWQNLDDEFNIAFALSLYIMDNWTTTSAEFVKVSLEKPNLTQREIGEILNVSQAGISKTNKRAGLHEILRLEKRFYQTTHQIITTL